ncbi:hypothetical protein BDZ45DRAFT_718053 [Acephala macrosclerotiorum]|nr:hypothetical protein BDZ45DRAFT_718053 [Acephala macrosclerotiorum]
MDQMTASLVCLSIPTLGPIVAKIKDIFRCRKTVPTTSDITPARVRTVNQDSLRHSQSSALCGQYSDVLDEMKIEAALDNDKSYEMQAYATLDNRSMASFGGASAVSDKEMV